MNPPDQKIDPMDVCRVTKRHAAVWDVAYWDKGRGLYVNFGVLHRGVAYGYVFVDRSCRTEPEFSKYNTKERAVQACIERAKCLQIEVHARHLLGEDPWQPRR